MFLKTVQDAFFHFFSMLLNGAYASNLKLGGNLEFSWHSCNILRYCSNRCIVWFFIPANCPAQANRKFPFNYMLKSKFSLSRHFEYANEQITYHFWLWHNFVFNMLKIVHIFCLRNLNTLPKFGSVNGRSMNMYYYGTSKSSTIWLPNRK